MSADRFHRSTRGYALIADVLAPAVTAALPATATYPAPTGRG